MDCFVWLKLDKNIFKISKNIYICAAYIPPRDSTYWIHHHDSDPYETLEQDIAKFQQDGEIILIGDFNARTGTKPDYVSDFIENDDVELIVRSSENTLLDSLNRKHRSNLDSNVNTYGNKLLDICKGLGLRIMNGRTLGDSVGAYTCFPYNGKSTVDYIISGENIVPDIPILQVSAPTHLSDHAHISCTLNLGNTSILFNKNHNQDDILLNTITRFKWDNDSYAKFNKTLELPLIKEELMKIQRENFDLDQIGTNKMCQQFTEIVIKAAKLCLKSFKNHKSNKMKQNKPGFDQECKLLKQQSLSLGKLVQKYPKDPVIHGKYILAKKKFKKTVKEKYKLAKDQIMKNIMSCEQKDPKTFWKLINDLKGKAKKNINPIELDEWTNYFGKLHNSQIASNIDSNFQKKIIDKLGTIIKSNKHIDTFDQDFTLEEIKNGVKCLKANKSSGLDAVSNEMFKTGLDILNPAMCTMFNHILHSECYPHIWSSGYIVPLHKKGSTSDPSNYRGITISSCLGKLFAMLMNKRLMCFVDEHKIISNCQIGFRKNKRTSDHIFVLKCILEEAKIKKQPIYGCFIDLKKAFDTIWIKGLLFKLLQKYSISPKFVRILNSMYSNLKAQVYSNKKLGSLFNITIGTRQGCNLSPSLFNLFINDMPSILSKGNCDPVNLGRIKINTLMYADDTLLLSKSEKGLNRALSIIEIYCRKWQLQININKTKIMIFNKVKVNDISFQINGHPLEIVNKYTYLGIQISSSGSFTSAVKELASKALRAYFALKNTFINTSLQPNIYLKLFDSLVKPIALYGCEVWGAFGHKSSMLVKLVSNLLAKDNSPFEKLHLRSCKHILQVSKHASNMGTRAELGRFPLMFNVICSVVKYRIRLESFGEDDLLYHALNSQQNLSRNSYGTTTYATFTSKLLSSLGLYDIPKFCTDKVKCETIKLMKPIKEKCRTIHSNNFLSNLNVLSNSSNTKLELYSQLKTNYKYERYLNFYPYSKYIAKFRLSDHHLPIERGRYLKPKLARYERKCNLCHSSLGNELHALFECSNPKLIELKNVHMNSISNISNQVSNLPNEAKLLYFLKASDTDLIPIIGKWLCEVNKIYKKYSNNLKTRIA